MIFLFAFGLLFFGETFGAEKKIENVIITGIPAGIESGSEIEAEVDCAEEKGCKISLNCLKPGPKCQKIYFCLDQVDACYPRILYTEPFSVIKSEQKVYLRYYSLAETIEEEAKPPPEEKPPEEEKPPPKPEIVKKSLFERILEAIKNFLNRIFKFR